MNEREKAIGKYMTLKKELYDLGIKAQALVNDIQDETETFLSEKDFSAMDFKKVETLAKELQKIQTDFNAKAARFEELKNTYSITE